MMYNKFKFLIFLIYLLLIFSCIINNNDEELLKSDLKKVYKINYKKYNIPDKDTEKSVAIAFSENIDKFNPYLPVNDTEKFIVNAVFSSLFYFDPENELPEKNLIEYYYSSSDKLTYFFKLKKNIKFSDNSILNAYDVEASLSFLYDILKNSKIYNEFFILNKSLMIEVLSDIEFMIKTDVPNSNLIYALCDYPIIKKSQVKSITENYKSQKGNLNFIKIDEIMGSGPYYLKKIETDRLILEKNEHYFKKDSLGNHIPYTEKIIINLFNGNDYNFNYLNKNKIDIIRLNKKKFNEIYNQEKGELLKKYKIINTNSSQNLIYLAFNMNNDNKYSYMNKLILRKFIYENLLLQIKGKNNKKLIKKIIRNNNEFNKTFKNNLIDENRITLKILIIKEEQKLSEIAELIKNIFNENHEFEIIINKVSYVNYIENLLNKNDFDITLFYYNTKPGTISYYNLLKNNFSLINLDDANNNFSNNINSLLTKLYNETKPEKQKENINDLKEAFNNNYQYINIYSENVFYIINSKIKNFKVNSKIEDSINLKTIEMIYKKNEK
ncbi:MAG: hypothetical protein JXB50_01655 [Spirochaetes bacterium]|nr:hypothetical protein [Spirochaetota bacterium]